MADWIAHPPVDVSRRPPSGRNRLLANLPEPDFAALAPHLSETTLDRGRMLHEAGQPIETVYFPHGGLVSLLALLPDGHAVDTAAIGREGAVGLSAGLGAELAPGRAVVQVAGRAAQMPAARLAEVADGRKGLREMIARYDDMLLAHVQQAAACNTVHHVPQRLCRWLLCAHDRVDGDTVELTQEFLSGLLGVQRTTVTTICRVLQADGIVDVRRGRIQIRNPAALERRSCGCYRVLCDLRRQLTA